MPNVCLPVWNLESKSGIAGLAHKSIFLNESSRRIGTKSLRPKDRNRNFRLELSHLYFQYSNWLSGHLELSWFLQLSFPWGWKLRASVFSGILADPLLPEEGREGCGVFPFTARSAFALCLLEASCIPSLPCPKTNSVSARGDGASMRWSDLWKMCCGHWCSECSYTAKEVNMCTWSCLGLTPGLHVTKNSPVHCAGKVGMAALAKGYLLELATQPLGGESEGGETGGGAVGSSPMFAVNCHSFRMWRLSWCYLLQLKELYKQRGWSWRWVEEEWYLCASMHGQVGICEGLSEHKSLAAVPTSQVWGRGAQSW